MPVSYELTRARKEDSDAVDAPLREVARRLVGVKLLKEETASGQAQALAWATAMQYLSARVQGTPEEKPGREPDMSAAAAAAFRDVLAEVGKAAFKKAGVAALTPPQSPSIAPTPGSGGASGGIATGLRGLFGMRKK